MEKLANSAPIQILGDDIINRIATAVQSWVMGNLTPIITIAVVFIAALLIVAALANKPNLRNWAKDILIFVPVGIAFLTLGVDIINGIVHIFIGGQ